MQEGLLPLLKEKPDDWRESIYYQYYEFQAIIRVRGNGGVRNHRYKLIHFCDRWVKLYDLEKDPKLNSVYGELPMLKLLKNWKRNFLD